MTCIVCGSDRLDGPWDGVYFCTCGRTVRPGETRADVQRLKKRDDALAKARTKRRAKP
jgi:hypothetical protein